jgi:phosphopantothenoylcysteine decarboxylase/phosphopantothenate--cysteine ligase
MWQNAATRANAAVLAGRGVHLLGPGVGEQACGETGPGRLLEPVEIADAVHGLLGANGPLRGRRVLLTAGPTRECIDPVRFVSNRSSGKMGFAMAAALQEAGAEVVLVAGPVTLATPPGVRRINVESSEQMHTAVQRELPGTHIFVGTAAVADYRPSQVACQKIKKKGETLALEMTRTVDILERVSQSTPRPFVVGFAAETTAVEQHAREKLLRKNLDLIAANEVGDGKCFDCDENALIVLWRNGRVELPLASKCELAHALTGLIVERYLELQAATHAAASDGGAAQGSPASRGSVSA